MADIALMPPVLLIMFAVPELVNVIVFTGRKELNAVDPPSIVVLPLNVGKKEEIDEEKDTLLVGKLPE